LLPAAALAVAIPATTLLAACSGSSHAPSTTTSGTRPSGSTSVAATRWWSDAAGGQGTVVGTSQKVSKSLKPDRSVYCSMLKQTMAAGKSVLPGATATDPALATVTEAFVNELLAVAPPEVAGSWHVLGPVLVSVVKSGGALAGLRTHVDANAVSAAAKTVATDASAQCHLNLSR
jgi:hypothetical protein